MQDLALYIQHHVEIAHWIIFILLILAGFNIPISEDAILFTSGILASQYPQYYFQLFLAVLFGAYFSDLICYLLGRKIGPQLLKITFFSKIISTKKLKKISHYYEKHGIWTLFFGRFIPFGVRNALFFTAGLSKMNFFKFAVTDFASCSIAVVLYFNIYYIYGETVVSTIQKSNFFISIVIILGGIFFYIIKQKYFKNKNQKDKDK